MPKTKLQPVMSLSLLSPPTPKLSLLSPPPPKLSLMSPAALSIHNNGDDDGWNLSTLVPRAARNVDTGASHVNRCQLQVFNLLLSDSESKDDNNAPEFLIVMSFYLSCFFVFFKTLCRPGTKLYAVT
jgi:hypothetical protein